MHLMIQLFKSFNVYLWESLEKKEMRTYIEWPETKKNVCLQAWPPVTIVKNVGVKKEQKES